MIDKLDEMVHFAHVNAHTMMFLLLENTTKTQDSCLASCLANLARR